MKLELKHLAPYLPYGLKWDLQCLKQFTMSGLSNGTLYTTEGTVLNWEKHPDLPLVLKPILRPLYDLDASILIRVSSKNLDISMDSSLHYTVNDSECYYPSGYYDILKDMWLGNYEILLENHFDVFGLIDAGLAVNINTL